MTTLPEKITPAEAPSLYVKGGLTPFLNIIRAEALAEVPDVTTAKGRDRIASLAYKVSQSKTAIEKPGRAYLKYLKDTLIKDAETELREFVRACDEIRDAVRKPLTDIENRERDRIRGHEESLQMLANTGAYPYATRADAQTALGLIESWPTDPAICEEFLPAYQWTIETARAAIAGTVARIERAEAQIAGSAVAAERLRVARVAEEEARHARNQAHRAAVRAEAAQALQAVCGVSVEVAERIIESAEAGQLGRLRLEF